MADALGGHRLSKTGSSSSDHSTSGSSIASTSSLASLSQEKTSTALKSQRTLRQSSTISEMKAYPLPDPSRFDKPATVDTPPPPDPKTDEVLYPLQSYKRLTEGEHEVAKLSPRSPDKMPVGAAEPVLNGLAEELPAKDNGNKAVVIYDGEKTFTTKAVEVALRDYAVSEGDAVVVLVFLMYIWNPMGMKMVADVSQFGGANRSMIEKETDAIKQKIERQLRDRSLFQVCQARKIQLEVRMLPGGNPRALVAKEIINCKAACAIFNTNAVGYNNSGYYRKNLPCAVLRLRKDGSRLETISLFGQGAAADNRVSTASLSDTSSESGSMNSVSPSILSKLFGSRRSTGTGSLRHSPDSVMALSRTVSHSGKGGPVTDILNRSFSFDCPNPEPAGAFASGACRGG